jgi:hypothetical protein
MKKKSLKTKVFILLGLVIGQLVVMADDQVDDLNEIHKISAVEEDAVTDLDEAVDFGAAWKVYERMKARDANSVYTKYAMTEMASLALELPISDESEKMWKTLLNDAGNSSDWSSVFVRGFYIWELSNREALGVDHGSKIQAATLLSGIDNEVLSQSLEREKLIINASGATQKIEGTEVQILLGVIAKIKNK